MKSVAEINTLLRNCSESLKGATQKFTDLDVKSLSQRVDGLIDTMKCPTTSTTFQAMNLQSKSEALQHLESFINSANNCTGERAVDLKYTPTKPTRGNYTYLQHETNFKVHSSSAWNHYNEEKKQLNDNYEREKNSLKLHTEKVKESLVKFLVEITKLPKTLSSIEELLKLSRTLAELDNGMELPRTSNALESITTKIDAQGDAPPRERSTRLPKSTAALTEMRKFRKTFEQLGKIMTLSVESIAPKVDALLESALNELNLLPMTTAIQHALSLDGNRNVTLNDALAHIRQLPTTSLPIDEITRILDDAVSVTLQRLYILENYKVQNAIKDLPRTSAALEALAELHSSATATYPLIESERATLVKVLRTCTQLYPLIESERDTLEKVLEKLCSDEAKQASISDLVATA